VGSGKKVGQDGSAGKKMSGSEMNKQNWQKNGWQKNQEGGNENWQKNGAKGETRPRVSGAATLCAPYLCG
jgi:hypothetical protein